MKEFPVLETDRLRLRQLMARDIDRIVQYANNPKIEEMTLNMPFPYGEKDAVSWLATAHEGFSEERHYVFGICSLQTDKVMGGIGLKVNKRFNRAELGFWLGEPFWSKGYITEGVEAVLEFGFNELELNKIFAFHMVKNPASGKVMTKNGMVKEAELVEHIRKGEEYIDVVQYRLTRKEFNRMDR
ncbi:GNAT family N-acetyltransferase [Fodinibius salsisoli]|uniref:GNAT family N-acetyltransferase n=1 Tax=Fodinibius salsisoli TaxID=2820877 RepID=A0ABT3PIR9_9BACT|nr:GNAT family N-acetyltransferase [Fodinibius salsisoli]MCW9705831.1 GNAT family N-acetyltransferase [Fodinibius salsisoli]